MSQSESLFSKGPIRCNTTSHRACKTSSAVFNVFVKKIRVHLCHLWENLKIIRMVNSLYSSNSCSRQIRVLRVHPCAKKILSVIQAITPHWSVDPKDKIREIRAIRVQKIPSAWQIRVYPRDPWENKIIIRFQEKSVFSVSIRVQELFVRTSVLDDRIVVYESGDIACDGSINNKQ